MPLPIESFDLNSLQREVAQREKKQSSLKEEKEEEEVFEFELWKCGADIEGARTNVYLCNLNSF